MTASFEWEGGRVAAAWHQPSNGNDYLVLAHGAGGSMNTPSMKAFADAIAARGLGAVRFNFPYADAGKKAPDKQPVLEASWRAVADEVAKKADRLFLGGRSMGGRIASHIVAAGYAAAGLVFLAYPLHPPGKPERIRDQHLYDIKVPMLFLEGTRDPFATPELLHNTIAKLPTATLHEVTGGDHSHRVAGRSADDVLAELVDATVRWYAEVV